MKKLFVAAIFAAGACVALADETYEFEETFKQQVESQKKADEEAEKLAKSKKKGIKSGALSKQNITIESKLSDLC